MSKRSLGRGLGDLLGSQRVPKQLPAPGTVQPARSVDVGLRILIDGAPGDVAPPTAAAPVPNASTAPPKTPASTLAKLSAVTALVAADLALLLWTAFFVLSREGELELGAVVGIGFSLLVAAFCGCAAALLVGEGK